MQRRVVPGLAFDMYFDSMFDELCQDRKRKDNGRAGSFRDQDRVWCATILIVNFHYMPHAKVHTDARQR